MIISLTGFMGCGKSSVGRELSRLLCCPFMDLDSVIEERAGRSIPEIFATDGEAAFRRLEAEALASLISAGCQERVLKQSLPSQAMGPSLCGQRGSTVSEPSPDSLICTDRSVDHSPTEKYCEAGVLALGGGTVMTPECAEMVHEKTLCVYLRASAETLVRNLEGEAEGRPMLASGEPLNIRIAALMAQRSDTYEKTAHIIIDTDGKSIGEIAGIIKEGI